VATSQAFWEALSLASRYAMGALAFAKASIAWKRENSNKEMERDTRDRQKTQHKERRLP
jgi:hypothetical protein